MKNSKINDRNLKDSENLKIKNSVANTEENLQKKMKNPHPSDKFEQTFSNSPIIVLLPISSSSVGVCAMQ